MRDGKISPCESAVGGFFAGFWPLDVPRRLGRSLATLFGAHARFRLLPRDARGITSFVNENARFNPNWKRPWPAPT